VCRAVSCRVVPCRVVSCCAYNRARWWRPLAGEAFINVCQGLLGAALALSLFIGILTSNEERVW